jgi:hypothetical protein
MGHTVGLATSFELSLGTNGLVYPWLREHFIPFRGLRVPARMAIPVGLSLAILGGYTVARISRARSSRPTRLAAVVVIGAAIAVEYHATLVLDDVWRRPPPVCEALIGRPDEVLIEWPLAAPGVAHEATYMYSSTFHWHPLVKGVQRLQSHVIPGPPHTDGGLPDDVTMGDLRRRGVDYVVVHGAFFEPQDDRHLIARMDARHDL